LTNLPGSATSKILAAGARQRRAQVVNTRFKKSFKKIKIIPKNEMILKIIPKLKIIQKRKINPKVPQG
jgi:hypothetical protein